MGFPEPDRNGVDAIRADGGLVHIRSVSAHDLPALQDLHARSSDRSIYLRFFSLSRIPADQYLVRLTRPSSRDHHALAACIRGEIVGVAAFERVSHGSAEFALLVEDAQQHEGIGTLLLEHLASVARHSGVRTFVADVLSENELMIGVLRDLGFRSTTTFDHGTVHVEFPLDPVPSVVAAIEGRERSADAASLQRLLSPASIAVVGAGERAGSVGHQVLSNLVEGGFCGTVAVVNPHHDEVLGISSYPSPLELPFAPDLAVVAVPAAQVPEVVRMCGVRGTKAVLLLTAGFGELGAQGESMQNDVVATAREYGMRLVGPNCVGVVNTDPEVRLDATFAVLPMKPGALGMLAQSGAFGIAFTTAAARVDVGISQFVSVGNKADVSGNDLLLFWEEDPRTRVIALYLESIGDARRFARIARRVSRSKPILAIKSGRTAAGRRAGMSHTAAAASPETAVDALFRDSGVLRMDTMRDMLDAARVLTDQPLPAGPRVAIIGNSGGPGIMAADAAAAAGLTVVDLDARTQRQLREAVPSIASTQNPVDLGAGARPEEVENAVRVMLESDDIDSVLTVFTELAVTDYAQIRAAVVSAVATTDKTVVATEVGGTDHAIAIPGSERSLPVFTFPEPAAAALGVAYRYARTRSSPRTKPSQPKGVHPVPARRLVKTALASGADWLRPDEVANLLMHYGISVSPQRLAGDADEAVHAAAELGYPLALKITGGGVHKSDIGGVRLGVADEAALRREFAALRDLADPGVPILLQPMITGGVEAIVGAVRDERFGPLVMLGAGGTLADLMSDRAFRLAPLAGADVDAMIGELPLARLLDGFRGAPAASRPAVRDVVVRIAALVNDVPEIAELDLNPVICRPHDAVVVDARIRVAPSPPEPDPTVRRLRAPAAAAVTQKVPHRKSVRSAT